MAKVRINVRMCKYADMQMRKLQTKCAHKKSAELIPFQDNSADKSSTVVLHLHICTSAYLHIYFVYLLIISSITLFFCNWGK